MIDTYIKSLSKEALAAYCSFFINATVPTMANENGGCEGYWYACIRAPFAISAVDEIELVDAQEGKAVCGIWAESQEG